MILKFKLEIMESRRSSDKWKEICFLLHQNISNNIDESHFEDKVLQVLSLLGWSQYRNEIVVRQKIHIGAAQRLEPDFIVKSKSEDISFVIEIKKPSVDLDSIIFKNQLRSYMRQLKIDIGLLIGNKIKIFYDEPENRLDPILLSEIEFNEDSSKGVEFVELFDKSAFAKVNLTYLLKEE